MNIWSPRRTPHDASMRHLAICAGCKERNWLIQRLVTYIKRGNLPELADDTRKDLAEAERLAGAWPGSLATHPYPDGGVQR